MIDYILIMPLLLTFLLVLFFLPIWIRKAKQVGLVWDDMNKLSSPKVAGSGGLIVVFGFVIGVLFFIAYRVFYLESDEFLIEILALLASVLLLAGIGTLDDLLGWQKGGLSRRSRIILVGLAAIPLMVINSGKSTMSLPFVGIVDLGYLYPLILIPIGIIGATSAFNFLAGFNGLEAGQGIILLSFISFITYLTGNSWLSIISLCMVLALIPFLFYNFYPAKVFPGNALTYVTGGLIAIFSILGDFEKIALFFFIPYILETILKSRGKLQKQSFGLPKKDGTLDLRYEKIYGLEHLSIWVLNKTGMKATEKKVVFLLWAFQIFIILVGLLIFREGIFLQ